MTLLLQIIAWTIPVVFAITLHEAAHAWTANRLGDSTAKRLGRLSFNPLHHIDLLGTILVPLLIGLLSHFNFIFGWAKPVPINWRNLRHPRRDESIVAAAGPIINLIMVIFWVLCCKAVLDLGIKTTTLGSFLLLAGQVGVLINLMLALINMLPIPPLDGSRIMANLLPRRYANVYMKLEPYGFIILFILLFSRVLGDLMEPIMGWFIHLIGGFIYR